MPAPAFTALPALLSRCRFGPCHAANPWAGTSRGIPLPLVEGWIWTLHYQGSQTLEVFHPKLTVPLQNSAICRLT